MRSITFSVLALSMVSSLSAQQWHQATPLDQLLKQVHARHHLVAEMDALPAKVPDGFNAAAVKAFTITAHQFDFDINPSPFVVNVGDSVTLDVTSSDVTHGFFLEHYMSNDVTMSKGQHRTITFVANTPGIFTYACTVSTCGDGHGDMVGDMVVQAAAAAPAISSFTPTSGTTAGGTVVAISGSNFQNGASVKFGDTTAVSVTVNSSSSISAMSPARSAGDVAITVTNPDGQSAMFGTFTYTLPGPAITSIVPSTGSTAGGTPITINGTNF
ncbi:MAG TPA: IPT/TIG domain-containing protein, partial [Thermoanaerobaculia bacterium]